VRRKGNRIQEAARITDKKKRDETSLNPISTVTSYDTPGDKQYTSGGVLKPAAIA
jgi:hypothetical protein